jgi:prepilin-type N-terminal cleavage/methylation domain-containing protein
MGSKRGVTIIEIALVMVILGVFAAHALFKYQKTIAFNELEKSANRAYLDLRALRAQAFKWDTLVITKFYSDSFATWIDTNGSASCDQNDIRTVTRFPASVGIGLPADPPTRGPYGQSLSSSTGTRGDWADSLTVFADSRGEYCHGEVYLYSKKIPKTTYCIGITHAMQSIEFYRWDGSWRKL